MEPPIGEPEFESAAISGHNARIGDVKLRNVHVAEPTQGRVHPVGSDVVVRLQLFTDDTTDALTGASSSVASSVQLQQDLDGDGTFEATNRIALPDQAPDAKRPRARLVLMDVKEVLRIGTNVPVSMTFDRAGTLRMNVPVEIPTVANATPSPLAS